MRILIIEDEQSSADRLKRMLEGEHEIVGVCASNAEVKTFFAKNTHTDVDLILSDIQLGDGLSFESLKTVPTAIPVIFTTAFDQYAVQAFQFNSLDYLLKPIDNEELQAALGKVQSSKFKVQSSSTDAIAQLLASVKSQTIRYRERFLIPHRADASASSPPISSARCASTSPPSPPLKSSSARTKLPPLNAGWIRKKYEDTIITTQGGTDSCFQGRNAGGIPAWLSVVL